MRENWAFYDDWFFPIQRIHDDIPMIDLSSNNCFWTVFLKVCKNVVDVYESIYDRISCMQTKPN